MEEEEEGKERKGKENQRTRKDRKGNSSSRREDSADFRLMISNESNPQK